MLITTSRKPSNRTRSFCQDLSHVLNAKYVNRGKMSFRDALLKSATLGFQEIAIVSQIKGNPSKIEIYNKNNELLLFLKITVSLLNLKGKINSDALNIRCEIEELKNPIINILKIPEGNSRKNLIWIKKGEGENKAIIEFYDKEGSIRDPRIYVKSWRFK
ncbi:Brix domain-containing protein [Methanobacterium sp.]|uniref:Brix domain-containing protein n=1 Tax=Methanobacterium sp. TaxID=2164 RepID=UPI003C742ED8